MKKRYLDLMERALDAYSYGHIVRYFETVKKEGMSEHGFPRLTANMGILISKGRKKELLPIFCQMMDFVCESFLKVKAGNDFSVKEVIFCILELEGKEIVPGERIDRWKELLSCIDPYKCYNIYARKPDDDVNNWACFTGVSEFMRQYIGLARTQDFVDIQIASQLRWLDESGLYVEPGSPVVYDLVPRGLFAVLLHFGYEGKYKEEMDACLEKTGMITLKMQSVSGEIPYGGRSNQFLHNEAHLSLLLEYEANRYAARGDMETAGGMKAAVSRALDNMEKWLGQETIRHVKNYYPVDSMIGCEGYAYFDKYMITAASFLYVAYLFCNEGIKAADFDRNRPYTLVLPPVFHRLFLNAGGYFLEYDWEADQHYDAGGLGRVHREGVPEALCISVPCNSHPAYSIDVENPMALTVCPGYMGTDGPVFGTGEEAGHQLRMVYETPDQAAAQITLTLDGRDLEAEYIVSESGVEIDIKGSTEVTCLLPAFMFDGETKTTVVACGQCLKVDYKGHSCIYRTDGEISDLGRDGANRNGRYHGYYAKGSGHLKVRIELK